MRKLSIRHVNFAAIAAILGLFAVGFVSYEESHYKTTVVLAIGNVVAIIFLLASSFHLKKSFQRERVAQAEKLRFSLFVQNSHDLIAISGPDSPRTIMYVNKAGRTLLGIDDSVDLSKLSAPDFYPESFASRLEADVIPALRNGGVFTGEWAYKHFKTGEEIPIFMTLFPLFDPETNEYLGLACVSRDIRDRKKLEMQIDNFFDVSLDMLGIATVDGYFTKLNPAFTEVLGWSEAELCAHPATYFIHPDDLEKTQAQLVNQQNGKSVSSFENRYRTKTGEYRWLSWKSTPHGKLTYGAARDITEEKNQQELLAKLSQQAIAASKAKSEFLANMSHEIRTPINGVIGMTSLLMDSDLTAPQTEFAENIKISADSLLHIINDILDFSKIEAGRLDFETVDFDLETLVQETAKNHAYSLRNKSIPLVVSIEPGASHSYRGDPGRVRQVLNNLLSNAVKFTATGSVRLTVTREREGETWTEFKFAVIDSGIGLSPESQIKLFQAFSQADASTTRRFGGTGLGLSISKRLVEMMDGRIGLISAEGQGSTFWFTLTFDHGKSIPRALSKTSEIKTKFPHARILVAEDNFVNQKILLGMLTKMGFSAQAVGNGNEVISILQERDFDLILMDCQMPELDGYSATREIRSSRTLRNPYIPIIAMTANALIGDREKCIEAGMNDYASKPIAIDELANVVESWLERVLSQTRASS